jgi:hypothetical protein
MSKKLKITESVSATPTKNTIRKGEVQTKGSVGSNMPAPSGFQSGRHLIPKDRGGDPTKAYSVSFHGLRATLDGLEVHHPDVRPSDEVWESFEQTVDSGDALVGELTGSKGQRRGTLSFQGRRLGVAALRFTDDRLGIRLDVRRPLPSDHSAKRQSAGVVVTMSGRGFSTRRQGVSYARSVLRGLERLLFPERGSTDKRRWKKMAPHRFVRDVHLAVDVAVRGPDASLWIREELFRSHNPQNARKAWVTRSKASSKSTEPEHDYRELDCDNNDAWSFRLQGSCVRFTVYEKDREPKSWPNVEKVLTRCGLEPGDRVIRIEWKLGAEWLRQQKIAGRSITKLSLDEFFEALPELAEMLGERYRHAVPSSGTKARWKTSEFGTALQAALASLKVRGKGALKSIVVQATDVQKVMQGSAVRLQRELWRQRACGGPDGAELTPEEVMDRISRWFEGNSPEAVTQRVNHERRRLGLSSVHGADSKTPPVAETEPANTLDDIEAD